MNFLIKSLPSWKTALGYELKELSGTSSTERRDLIFLVQTGIDPEILHCRVYNVESTTEFLKNSEFKVWIPNIKFQTWNSSRTQQTLQTQAERFKSIKTYLDFLWNSKRFESI